MSGAALSSARATGCALHGASLSLVSPRESNQREGDPDIRVWPLRAQTSLTPVPLREHVTKGHPCPFVPRSASMPRVPLRNACVRPPEGGSDPSRLKEQRLASLCFFMHGPTGDTTLPLADGRVEPARRGASDMDAARGLGVPAIKGHGWPLYAAPRSAGGRREVQEPSSRTRMKGRRVGNAKLTHRFLRATFETNRCGACGGKCCAVFHPTNF